MTVQVPVRIPVRTCGLTLSVYLDPAALGVAALLDRSGLRFVNESEGIVSDS